MRASTAPAILRRVDDLRADLSAEQSALDRAIAATPADRWDAPSPADGWLMRDCLAHLAEFDDFAATVIRDRAVPQREAGDGVVTRVQLRARDLTIAELLAWWREARQRLAAALAPLDPRERLPWVGPPMSARSFATARLMEAWSHGLDILESAGVAAVDTDRLRHVAHLGYVTRDFAYRNRGLPPPETPLRLDLIAPSGAAWTWGPTDAPDRITGAAGEFCRVVTQRIHPADTALVTHGPRAAEYLALAQAFAGPPGPGRPQK